jgi:hypothetical protein
MLALHFTYSTTVNLFICPRNSVHQTDEIAFLMHDRVLGFKGRRSLRQFFLLIFFYIFLIFPLISSFSPSVTHTIQTANLWRPGASGRAAEQVQEPEQRQKPDALAPDSRSDSVSQKPGNPRAEELSLDDRRRVDAMKATDRAVRAHEAAHVAAGGSLVTSGATFSYETGPDGQRYAVAGEVGIDTSKGRTPEETLIRAQQIRAAALAPADPSGQDRAVAAAAAQMAADAHAEIASTRTEKDPTGKPAESDANRGHSFGQAIERSLSPNGQTVNVYA